MHVFVATTGADLDADGYTVVLSPDPGEILFTYTDTVSSNDSTEFTIQGSGSYYPSLSGIAPNCTPTRYADPVVLTEAGGRIDVALAVQCFAPPAGQGIRVATVLTGIYDVNAPTTLVVQSDTASTGPFFLQSYLLRSGETRLVPLPVGQFHAFVWRPDCAVQPANDLPASVQANRATDVTFTLTCVPPGTAP